MSSARREVEHVMRTIFKRCVVCDSDDNARLSCADKNCPKGEVCVQTPASCDACASVECKIDPTVSNDDSGPSTNVGAIAGGVIGGIAFIAIVVFVVWKFCLKGKRRPISEVQWQEVDMMEQQEKAETDFESRRSARASTHTVASMASSVLTRASNIIQIAYIPGVTNRSGPGSPDLLVPPVPPIPAMSPSSGLSSPYAASEQHFFVPDFRDSMASTSTDARTSIAPSLARNSVASTVYRQNAIVSPLPAQTVVRGKAAVVSVKSSGSNSPNIGFGGETPPVPQIDPKHQKGHLRIHMPGISPANSVKTIAQLGGVKALNITKKKSMDSDPPKSSSGASGTDSERTLVSPDPLVPAPRPLTEVSLASTDDGMSHRRARQAISIVTDSDSDDDDHSRARKSLLRNSEVDADTPTSIQSPFSDSPLMGDQLQVRDSSRGPPMTPIFEESSKRGSTISKRGQSPFSDAHKSDL